MGQEESKQSLIDSINTSLVSDIRILSQQEIQQTKGCCCFGRNKQIVQMELWVQEYKECCESLRGDYGWAEGVIKVFKETNEERVECIKEFRYLKEEFENGGLVCQKQSILSDEDFKSIIENSSILQPHDESDTDVESMSSFIVRSTFKNRPKTYKPGGKIDLMVSMVNQNMKTLFAPHKIDRQLQSGLLFFVKFTQMIQKHSSNKFQGILSKTLNTFINWILKQYSFSTLNIQLIEQIQQNLITDVNSFIQLYTILINLYYKLTSVSQDDKIKYIFAFDNIKSAVTTILFKNQEFYETVYNILHVSEQKSQQIIQKIMEVKRDIKPEEMRILPQYCLNQSTMLWYTSRTSVIQGVQNIQIPTLKECQPYESCIQKFKLIKNAHTPISKLKVIISSANKINESVNRFYALNQIRMDHNVDSDQILTIFMYIILKSDLFELKTHLKLIENFCTQQQLLSQTGYYSKVSQAALGAIIMNSGVLI